MGEGDDNGILQSPPEYGNASISLGQCEGETGLFWVDLSRANLIDGSFNSASATSHCLPFRMTDQSQIALYLPHAKITGGNNYVMVRSGELDATAVPPTSRIIYNGKNYFTMQSVTQMNSSSGWSYIYGGASLSVAQAYAIDSKIDDGFPLSGKITDIGITKSSLNFVNGASAPWYRYYDLTIAIAPSSTTCFDDGNNSNNPVQYSMSYDNGKNSNCVLSFEFQ